MPSYVATIAAFNPLSYMVDALRTLMVEGSVTHFGVLMDFAVLAVVDVIIILIAARLYPRVVQ